MGDGGKGTSSSIRVTTDWTRYHTAKPITSHHQPHVYPKEALLVSLLPDLETGELGSVTSKIDLRTCRCIRLVYLPSSLV
jgi:hypothetical protein